MGVIDSIEKKRWCKRTGIEDKILHHYYTVTLKNKMRNRKAVTGKGITARQPSEEERERNKNIALARTRNAELKLQRKLKDNNVVSNDTPVAEGTTTAIPYWKKDLIETWDNNPEFNMRNGVDVDPLPKISALFNNNSQLNYTNYYN